MTHRWVGKKTIADRIESIGYCYQDGADKPHGVVTIYANDPKTSTAGRYGWWKVMAIRRVANPPHLPQDPGPKSGNKRNEYYSLLCAQTETKSWDDVPNAKEMAKAWVEETLPKANSVKSSEIARPVSENKAISDQSADIDRRESLIRDRYD